jgi:hypothetical protein
MSSTLGFCSQQRLQACSFYEALLLKCEGLERTEDTYRVRAALQLAVYRQSVRLGTKPLETHDQEFYFPTEQLRL